MKRVLFLFVLFLTLVFAFLRADGKVREPAVAGGFYPADPEVLSRVVDSFLAEAPAVPIDAKRVVALVVPHAGYVYSGRTAGKAYGLLRGISVDTVLLVGPSHFVPVRGVVVYPGEGFRTPLGVVPVDEEVRERLISSCRECFSVSEAPFIREHSLEVQVPFIQRVFPRAKILPLVVNDLDQILIKKAVRAVARACRGRRVLVVASSDLSHYHPRERARQLDGIFRRDLEMFAPERMLEDLAGRRCEACGGAGVVLALAAAREMGGRKVFVVDYSDSGDVTGDTGSVVGYISAVVLRPAGEKEGRVKMEKKALKGPRYLTVEERKELLEIARKTLEVYLDTGRMPDVEVRNPALRKEGAAFVTLEKGNRLRGCIGYTEPRFPLYRTVMECAIAAATEDPRFPPVTREELDDLTIEISVLTPFREVEKIDEIEVGRHGLMVIKGFHRGLLLPQVPVEYGWDRETFLSQTCVKAGLPPDEWKKGVKILSFEAEVFGEEELN